MKVWPLSAHTTQCWYLGGKFQRLFAIVWLALYIQSVGNWSPCLPMHKLYSISGRKSINFFFARPNCFHFQILSKLNVSLLIFTKILSSTIPLYRILLWIWRLWSGFLDSFAKYVLDDNFTQVHVLWTVEPVNLFRINHCNNLFECFLNVLINVSFLTALLCCLE